MVSSFIELISKSQIGDKEALEQIIFTFEPTIKKFSRQLNYAEAETDLIIAIIELVKKMNTMHFDIKNDGAVVNYIYNSLKNKKVDLFKTHILGAVEETEINYEAIPDTKSFDFLDRIVLKDALNSLSYLQKGIIYKEFVKGYSEKEIADIYHISRQAVNRAKNRALRTLRDTIAV